MDSIRAIHLLSHPIRRLACNTSHRSFSLHYDSVISVFFPLTGNLNKAITHSSQSTKSSTDHKHTQNTLYRFILKYERLNSNIRQLCECIENFLIDNNIYAMIIFFSPFFSSFYILIYLCCFWFGQHSNRFLPS